MFGRLAQIRRSLSRQGKQLLRPAERATTQDFAPAVFSLRSGGDILPLNVCFVGLDLLRGKYETKLLISDHGIVFDCMVRGDLDGLEIDPANLGFIVPAALRRQGLATACLEAMRQSFQLAAFGRLLPQQPASLKGYFVGDGARFSRALCGGELPTHQAPAPICLSRLHAVHTRLQLEVAPLPV